MNHESDAPRSVPAPLKEIQNILLSGRALDGTLVGEEPFQRMIPFWTRPCIDTTDYGWETAIKIRKLQGVGGPGDILDHEHRLLEFLRSHFDYDSGGFRHHIDSWPTICASLLAVRLLSKLNEVYREFAKSEVTNNALSELLHRDGHDRFVSFIRGCESPEGGFSETIRGMPNTISTRAGYGLLFALGLDPQYPEKTVKFVEDSIHSVSLSQSKKFYGVAYSPDAPQPTTAASHYTVQLFYMEELRHDFPEAERLWKRLKTQLPGFVGACKRQVGYAPSVLGADRWTTDSTRHAIALCQNLGKSFASSSNMASARRLLLEMGTSSYNPGFSSESPPNIFSLRNALSIVERLHDVSPAITQNILESTHMLQRFEEMLLQFSEPDGAEFSGYSLIGSTTTPAVLS